MAVINGTCEYCGQTNLTDECDCSNAKIERKKAETFENAEREIKKLFPDSLAVDFLTEIAEMLIDGEIRSVKIDFDGFTSASLKLDTKDNIQIERSYKTKSKAEVKQLSYI